MILLEEQDRSLWDRDEIREGLELVDTALRLRNVGPYQLQSAIAALHAQADAYEQTDWRQINALYVELYSLSRTPVIALNHAVAIAMSEGIEKGLRRVDEIGADGALDDYHLFHAARADLLRRLGRTLEAIKAYSRALELTRNPVEQNYLRRRLIELTPSSC